MGGNRVSVLSREKLKDSLFRIRLLQVEDGTIFHLTQDLHWLQVRWHGQTIQVRLADRRTKNFHFIENGNRIYFVAENKISSAFFNPPNGIQISHLRDGQEGEEFHKGGICTRVRDGVKYFARIYDNPEGGMIIENESTFVNVIHRGRAVHCDPNNDQGEPTTANAPFVRSWTDKEIISCKSRIQRACNALDSVPFIYLVQDHVPHILNTNTMEFYPEFGLRAEKIDHIAGIHNGVIASASYTPATYHYPFPTNYLVHLQIPEITEAAEMMREYESDEDDVEKAFEEVCALAALKHDGIVCYNTSWLEKPPVGWQKRSDEQVLQKLKHQEPLNDYKNDCVFIYIQMELCTQTLQDWLYSTQDRDLAQAKIWFTQLVSAVGFLHKNDKIHRDLKPLNILFDSNSRLKICDLGLVTEIVMRNGQEIDKTRTSIGTPTHMAPEQHLWSYTSKVDIFSLGLILIELCVCMTKDMAFEVFKDYQKGKHNDILLELPEVDHFVSWLTKINPLERPSCEEILAHEFLA